MLPLPDSLSSHCLQLLIFRADLVLDLVKLSRHGLALLLTLLEIWLKSTLQMILLVKICGLIVETGLVLRAHVFKVTSDLCIWLLELSNLCRLLNLSLVELSFDLGLFFLYHLLLGQVVLIGTFCDLIFQSVQFFTFKFIVLVWLLLGGQNSVHFLTNYRFCSFALQSKLVEQIFLVSFSLSLDLGYLLFVFTHKAFSVCLNFG